MKKIFYGDVLASDYSAIINDFIYIYQANYPQTNDIGITPTKYREAAELNPYTVAIFRVKPAKGSIHERLGAKILLQ